jgi:hypothetical protein
MSGSTVLGTVTQNINGSAGALLAAGSSTSPITSVIITAPPAAGGFAMAQFRFSSTGNATAAAPVPALNPAGLGALSLLLMGMGSLLVRSHNTKATNPRP